MARDTAMPPVGIDCHAQVTISALATHCGLSRERFSREFRREVGIAPLEPLHRRLVQRACEALLSGDPVTVVADRLRFADPFTFSRFFRRRTGVPPRDFRAGRMGLL